jgi:serine/threonine-protein kinase Chk2
MADAHGRDENMAVVDCGNGLQRSESQGEATQPFLDLMPPSQRQPEPVAVLRSLMVGLEHQVYIFAETREVVIGRRPCRNDEAHAPEVVPVTVNSPHVSNLHCRLLRVPPEDSDQAGQFFLQDNSSNGTWLNGRRLEKGTKNQLHSGDELSLVQNSCNRNKLSRSKGIPAFMLRVFGEERSTILKDAGQRVEEKYNLQSVVLGSGGFSQVLLCTSRSTLVQMALKVVDKKKFLQFRRTRQTALTVDSERRVMERIDHPNIVKLHETFDTPSCFYLVMEYLPGGDLLQRILDHGIYEYGVTRRLFSNVLSGIGCLHENGIVHRDIKPENILLTSTDDLGIAKIADMGVAKHLDDDCASAQIQRATVCGTMNYFAPEMVQAAEGGPACYGKAVDIWAAGVVLYIMLCGFPPFDEDNLYEQIGSGTYDFAADEWETVSSLAKDMIQQLMKVHADQRLTVSEAIIHPWMGEHASVKRRKTESGGCYNVSDDVAMTDALMPEALERLGGTRTCARKIATPSHKIAVD